MALFRITDKKASGLEELEELDEIGFENELEMQRITEKNLRDILGLDFICSEFSVKDRRIDTLAFNEEAKSFIIIEYKISKSSSVVDQGMNYLSLMLENRAEFVLEYNRIKEVKMDKKSFDWSQSKVIFISHMFTRQQKGAINFRDFPMDMWEAKKYKNNLVDYKQVEKSATQASIKELLGKDKKMATKEKSIGRVLREIKIYTEEDHFNEVNKDMVDLYNKFKSGILNLDENITIKPYKSHISFNVRGITIAFILIHKNQLTIRINMPQGELKGSEEIMEDTSKSKSEPRTDYKNKNKITSDKDLECIVGFVKQSLEYKDKKRSVRNGK